MFKYTVKSLDGAIDWCDRGTKDLSIEVQIRSRDNSIPGDSTFATKAAYINKNIPQMSSDKESEKNLTEYNF